MMKKIILYFAFLCTVYGHAQESTYAVWGENPISGKIENIQFINDNVGFCTSRFFGQTESFLLKTTDGGKHWKPFNDSVFGSIDSFYAIDENNIWLVSTHSPSIHDGYKGVFVTSDGGKSWQNWQTWFNPADTPGYSLITEGFVKFFGAEKGYLNIGASLLKTVNRGKSWTTLQTSITNVLSINSETLIAFSTLLGQPSISKTTDGGLTWQNFSVPEYGGGFEYNYLSFVDENLGFYSYNWKLYKTKNGGNSWQIIPYDTSEFHMEKVLFADEFVGYGISPGGRVYVTKNGGSNWTQLPLNDSYSAIYQYNNKIYFSGFRGNISKLENNTIEPLVGNKLNDSYFFNINETADAFYALQNNAGWASASQTNHFKTKFDKLSQNITNTLLNFENPNSFHSVKVNSFATNPSKTVEITYPQPYRSTDFVNYTPLFNANNTNTNYAFSDIQFYDDDSAYATDTTLDRVFKTTDKGTTWQVILADDDDYWSGVKSFHMFNPNSLLVAGRNNILYKTTDGGINWSTITVTNDPEKAIDQLYFITDLIGWAYGTNSSIYKTIDGGNTWIEQVVGVAKEMFFLNENEGWYYNGYTYRTTNGGNTWEKDSEQPAHSLGHDKIKINFKDSKTGYAWTYYEYYNYLKTPKCPQITGYTLIPNNNTYNINVTWTSSEDATAYKIYFYNKNFLSGEYEGFNNYVGRTNDTSYTFENLSPSEFLGGAYPMKPYIKVKPVNFQNENTDCNDKINIAFSPLSVSESENSITKLYPNPSDRIINIINKKPILNIEIYSTDGKLVLKSTNTSVDISVLPTGMYFVKINFEDKSKENLKFIKK